MRAILLIWGVLLGGGLVGLILSRDSGYALLTYNGWTLETSLAVLVLLITSGYLLTFLLLRLLGWLWRLPGGLGSWRQRRASRLAHEALQRGLARLVVGDWASAEVLLSRHIPLTAGVDSAQLNVLAAAWAAQLQGATDRRDQHLRRAETLAPPQDVGVALSRAELQSTAGEWRAALRTLQALRERRPKHPRVLALLRQAQRQVGDWAGLAALLPELERRRIGSAAERQALALEVHGALLEQAAADADAARLEAVWREIPRPWRKAPALIDRYCKHLLSRRRDTVAEALLRRALNQQFDDALVARYGQLRLSAPAEALAVAEGWLAHDPAHPGLLLTLGRLSLQAKLWGKARQYLEAAIGAGADSAAYVELGHLLARMGETDAALATYREGLQRQGLEPVPLPERIGEGRQALGRRGSAAAEPPRHGARTVSREPVSSAS